jgi:hypothetical protein
MGATWRSPSGAVTSTPNKPPLSFRPAAPPSPASRRPLQGSGSTNSEPSGPARVAGAYVRVSKRTPWPGTSLILAPCKAGHGANRQYGGAAHGMACRTRRGGPVMRRWRGRRRSVRGPVTETRTAGRIRSRGRRWRLPRWRRQPSVASSRRPGGADHERVHRVDHRRCGVGGRRSVALIV